MPCDEPWQIFEFPENLNLLENCSGQVSHLMVLVEQKLIYHLPLTPSNENCSGQVSHLMVLVEDDI